MAPRSRFDYLGYGGEEAQRAFVTRRHLWNVEYKSSSS